MSKAPEEEETGHWDLSDTSHELVRIGDLPSPGNKRLSQG